MAINFDNYKTPIFPGINDTPIPPTTTKAGNGSDLIARVNGLIDALANLPTGGEPSINWTVKLPSASNYLTLEIYYPTQPDFIIDSYIDSANAFGLSQVDLIGFYALSFDIQPNGTIDISNLVKECGVGYYFFIFRESASVLKEGAFGYVSSSSVKGATTYLRDGVNVYATNDQFNSSTQIRSMPIVVRQIASEVEITLMYDPPEIG